MTDKAPAATQPTRTGLIWDERCKQHDTGSGHPERSSRLETVIQVLSASGLAGACTRLAARPAADEEILAVHERRYLDRLIAACSAGARFIDTADSAICPASAEAARLAAGAALAAVDAVMAGTVGNAFCAIRPPGHHCERGTSMGFCLLNNVAIAAEHLRGRYGLRRIAVVDWDVHHGNGTQHAFEETDEVLVCNLHGHPAYVYPGTGYAEERGIGAGADATLNIPFYPGATDNDYRAAFDTQVLPLLESYQPQFVLISAGFDAHRRDPLAPIDLDTASFGWMTRSVADVARRFSRGRLVSLLEGGYDLRALGESVELHVRELIAANAPVDPN